jgi:hypothetical protein
MSGLNDLVRKFKQAVTGAEEAPKPVRPFQWEPAAAGGAPAPVPVLRDVAAREPEPPPPVAGAGWKRAGTELPSVVGGQIPADVADFATVYKGAAVHAPQHEYGVDRVAGMLEHKSLAGLDKSVKASAVLAALDAASVSVKDVIHDGLLRYKALVAFEAAKELELHQVRPKNERRIEELKAASESFQKKKQEEIDALSRESASALASLTRLKTRQRAEEERFHRTLALFVEPLPARVIAMPVPAAKPVEAIVPAAEAKPSELKLVAPTPADATQPVTAAPTPAPAAAEPAKPAEPAAPAKPEEKKS